ESVVIGVPRWLCCKGCLAAKLLPAHNHTSRAPQNSPSRVFPRSRCILLRGVPDDDAQRCSRQHDLPKMDRAVAQVLQQSAEKCAQQHSQKPRSHHSSFPGEIPILLTPPTSITPSHRVSLATAPKSSRIVVERVLRQRTMSASVNSFSLRIILPFQLIQSSS